MGDMQVTWPSVVVSTTIALIVLVVPASRAMDESGRDSRDDVHRHALRGSAKSVQAGVDAAPAVTVGEVIYRRGVLESGKSVEARREGGMLTGGPDAACANCHQRSGLGTKEGLSSIPPIAGLYLSHPRVANVEDLGLPYVEGVRVERPPYNDETLARAIRKGIGADGKALSYLMPRYELGDTDMASLIAYLKKLEKRKVPGVTDTVLHFATVITPDADPVERRGMLDVLEHYFAEKNALQRGAPPPPHFNLHATLSYRAFRRWQLHVWELTGPAATWEAQLDQHLVKEPVFAVVSGLGGKNWAPVQNFCEHQGVPCLFPNVQAPPAAHGDDFYSLYFSRGVLLEADLIAHGILEPVGGKPVKRVDQIYRANAGGGESAALALAATLESRGIAVRSHVLATGTPGKGVADALHSAAGADTLVLWLRPADIAVLGEAPAASTEVFMSAVMGGLEPAPLPANWRAHTRVAYPFDPPDKRGVRLDYPLGWFHFRRIPVVAERVQVDTYLACVLLSDALNHVVDAFVRDYLVEHVFHILEGRVITGYYPHLALSTGQRFASKGGYLVHFADPTGSRLVADSGWLVP